MDAEIKSLLPVPLEGPDNGSDENRLLALRLLDLGREYMSWLNKSPASRAYSHKRCTAVLRLLHQGHVAGKLNLFSVVSREDIHRELRSVSGLMDTYGWLQQQSNANAILKQSGQASTLESLWGFRINVANENWFESLERLSKMVSDLQAWLKVVAMLSQENSWLKRLMLAVGGQEGLVWKKDMILRLFLIGTTLESEKIRFNLDDVKNFLLQVENYPAWLAEVSRKVGLYPKNSGLHEFFDSEASRDILRLLEKPENRSVLDFAKSIPLDTVERRLVNDFDKLFSNAVQYAVRKRFDDEKLKAMRTVDNRLEGINGHNQAVLLRRFPFFGPYLSHERKLEILAYEGRQEDIMSIFELGAPNSAELFWELNRQWSLSEIIAGVNSNDSSLAKVLALAEKAKKLKRQPFAEPTKVRMAKSLVGRLSDQISLVQILEWLEQYPDGSLAENLPESVLLAAYFMGSSRDKAGILPVISRHKWFIYLDANSHAHFLARVASRTPSS